MVKRDRVQHIMWGYPKKSNNLELTRGFLEYQKHSNVQLNRFGKSSLKAKARSYKKLVNFLGMMIEKRVSYELPVIR